MNKGAQVHFVYRKPNPGNYSIENVFDLLIAHWETSETSTVTSKKIRLKHNYDLLSFLSCFLRSLFGVFHIAHITGGCNYMVMAFPFTRRILTIHDLFYLDQGEMKFRQLYVFVYYTLPIWLAHTITVVSEQTKEDLIKHFPGAEKKVTVIANPLNPSLAGASKDIQIAATPKAPLKILQLGSKPLKNYENLILAAKELDVAFSFVHGDTTAINALITKHGLEKRAEVLSELTFTELIDSYLAADVLFFASFSEGFGLPLLEAQALHLPVITSDLEPMRSVAPHAILVDPQQLTEIKAAIQGIINDGVRVASLEAAAGFTQQFTAAKIAAQYEAIYLPGA